ncbi:hypothetical protein Tco_0815752 [Tanacetum coccineum]
MELVKGKPEAQWTLMRGKDDKLISVLKISYVGASDGPNELLSNGLTAKSTWDFKGSPDDEKDTRSSHEYVNDLEEEYQAKALLGKLSLKDSSKRVLKDEKEVSSDNETEVKVLMALTDEERIYVGKKSARNDEWTKITIKKVHTLLEMDDNDDRKSFLDYLCIDLNYVEEQRNNLSLKHRNLVQELNANKEQLLLTEDTFSCGSKDMVFVKSSADNSDMSITTSNLHKSSKAKDYTLPNHNADEVPSNKSQRNTTDPSTFVSDSPASDNDSADESLVCNTPFLPLKKLDGAKPGSGF